MSDFIGEGAYIKDVDGYQFLIGNVRQPETFLKSLAGEISDAESINSS